MKCQTLLKRISLYLFWGLLLSHIAPAEAVAQTNFSLDPASGAIDGNLTPDDVLEPGPTVSIQGDSLGLEDEFFSGFYDNLNALSYGRDPIQNPLYFSVDRLALGLPNTAVFLESLAGEAAGDVFQTLPPLGNNSLVIDEEELGLAPGFFGDDLNALELDSSPNPFTYFSIDQLSATNGFGLGDLADDILLSDGSGSLGIFAEGDSMGIDDFDDLDALVLWDVFEPGVLNPGIDQALFSLSTFSASAFTFTFNAYRPGVKGSLSPADILLTDFSGDFSLWASALDLGLDPLDELDALDTIEAVSKVPEPLGILGTISIFGLAAFCSRKPKGQPQEPDSKLD
jgi:hypothetical protein